MFRYCPRNMKRFVGSISAGRTVRRSRRSAPRPTSPPSRISPRSRPFTLANGLQVAFLQLDTAPVVAVQVWYHAGSKDEPRDRRGSAHMFEHMMFKGTEHVRPEAHAQMLNGVGGYVNAQTDEDATHYINTVPSDYLDFAIQLEAERMRHLLFRKDMIDGEREVVKEEIRQQENSPLAKGFLKFLDDRVHEASVRVDRGRQHQGSRRDDARGSARSSTTRTTSRTTRCSSSSARSTLAAGQGERREVVRHDPEGRRAAAPVAKTRRSRRRPRSATRSSSPVRSGITIVGWHIPAAKDKDIYALQVASIILGAGDSSRLKSG